MGNVLIVKNNDISSDIYIYAKKSFDNGKKGYYNAKDNSDNENYLKKIKDEFGKDGLILFITYDYLNEDIIQNMFIGSGVEITDQNNIEYQMKIYLSDENDMRAMESIIDKIDLDMSKDFEPNCYIIMSTMDSLFCELHERIVARNHITLSYGESKEESEEETYQLHSLAQKDTEALRVYRTEFQRDRERVVNCKAFRRLVDKAQIFGSEKGDYYRTRMTHSLEVNQIAKAIAYALKLNLDLTEAIALGHDLGHTPFGHQEERTLDAILKGDIDVGLVASKNLLKSSCFGGFKHNYQSVRILTQLEEKYVNHPGLNVSVQVVEGVLKHTKLKEDIPLQDFLKQDYIDRINVYSYDKEQVCSTLEGQTVAIADEIAQRGHDVDDALTSGVMSIDEFIDRLRISKCSQLAKKIQNEIEQMDKEKRIFIDKKDLRIARVVSCIINYFISSTIDVSKDNLEKYTGKKEDLLKNATKLICFSADAEGVNSYLERVVQKKVICNNEVARADYNASMVVKTLFEKYYSNPRLLHAGTIHKIFMETLMHKCEAVANSAVNLDDTSIRIANNEIKQLTKDEFDEKEIRLYLQSGNVDGRENDVIIFEKRKILIRAITDYIAGMTDGYALEEFEKLK